MNAKAPLVLSAETASGRIYGFRLIRGVQTEIESSISLKGRQIKMAWQCLETVEEYIHVQPGG